MATAIQTPPTLTSSVLISSKEKLKHSVNRKRVLISASLLMCTLQLLWFASKCIHQIDADAISYTGIASELKQGLFQVSINGFRSPLISWLMAAIPDLPPFQSGKLITILTYAGSVVLLYAFTKKLWHSDVVAGFAALMFVVGRGVAFDAVALISADFLFAVLYTCLLLDIAGLPQRRSPLVPAWLRSWHSFPGEGLRLALVSPRNVWRCPGVQW